MAERERRGIYAVKELSWRKVLPYWGIPVLLLSLFLLQGRKAGPIYLLLWGVLTVFGYLASMGDLLEKRVPNRLIGWMAAAWVLIMVPQLFFQTEEALYLLLSGGFGFLMGGGLFLLVYLVSRGGLSGGDVKLMAASGLYLGFQKVMQAMLYGSILAALTGGGLILMRKIGRKDTIPLIPFLYAGILLSTFF